MWKDRSRAIQCFALLALSMMLMSCGNRQSEKATAASTAFFEDITDIKGTKGERDSVQPTSSDGLLIDPADYEPDRVRLTGERLISTVGVASVVKKADDTLWYFGEESRAPVKIMENVRSFQLRDQSDTIGASAPALMILTKDNALYGCGYDGYGIMHPREWYSGHEPGYDIPFDRPERLMDDVCSFSLGCRAVNVVTNDGIVHHWGDMNPLYFFEDDPGKIPQDTRATPEEMEDGAALEEETVDPEKAFILADTVQQVTGRNMILSVRRDGSVWTCYFPYYDGYTDGFVYLGNGDSPITSEPFEVFGSGACRVG